MDEVLNDEADQKDLLKRGRRIGTLTATIPTSVSRTPLSLVSLDLDREKIMEIP
jgi:hypothetical protein